MSDHLVYMNVTVPYANGRGRRLVWQSKSRVDAVSTEKALRSDNFRSIGKVVIHDDHYAICVLGGGLEIHLMCPGEEKHCKECGAIEGKSPVFCRTCNPRPVEAEGDELEARSTKIAGGKPVSLLKKGQLPGRNTGGRQVTDKKRIKREAEQILMDL